MAVAAAVAGKIVSLLRYVCCVHSQDGYVMWECDIHNPSISRSERYTHVICPCYENYAAMTMCKNPRVADFTPTNVHSKKLPMRASLQQR